MLIQGVLEGSLRLLMEWLDQRRCLLLIRNDALSCIPWNQNHPHLLHSCRNLSVVAAVNMAVVELWAVRVRLAELLGLALGLAPEMERVPAQGLALAQEPELALGLVLAQGLVPEMERVPA